MFDHQKAYIFCGWSPEGLYFCGWIFFDDGHAICWYHHVLVVNPYAACIMCIFFKVIFLCHFEGTCWHISNTWSIYVFAWNRVVASIPIHVYHVPFFKWLFGLPIPHVQTHPNIISSYGYVPMIYPHGHLGQWTVIGIQKNFHKDQRPQSFKVWSNSALLAFGAIGAVTVATRRRVRALGP